MSNVISSVSSVLQVLNDPLNILSDGDTWYSKTFLAFTDPFANYNNDYLIQPDIDIPSIAASPTYASPNNQIGNTISEGISIARCYGLCKIGGNKIRFNDAAASDRRMIVGHCVGEVEGITAWYINDLTWAELTGTVSKTEYKGTRAQTADGRFTVDASAYRGIAYTAFTFGKSDNQIGPDPNVVVIMQGLKCLPLAGGAKAFTRNPAVALYDWYLNVEGYTAAELDLNAFKSLEAFCNQVPTASSLPRYRFDFNYDADQTINDGKKVLWNSFIGRVVMSQGKLKPVWDAAHEADGSGGITSKTVKYAFTMDNILKDSITWKQPEIPNLVRVYYLDAAATTPYMKTSVEEKDEEDIRNNGEVLYEETCLFITDAEIARRRCKRIFSRKKYNDYTCELASFSGANKLEIYDLVTVTHTLPGWSAKQFIVVTKSEDQHGLPKFTLEAYYSGVYDDSQVGVQAGYASALSNPFLAEAVISPAIVEGGFIAGDGSYVPYVTLTFTRPDNSYWNRGQVWTSIDGVTFTFYGNTTTGTGFRIDMAKAGYAVGDTLSVKVLSENLNGVVQTLSAVVPMTVLIQGKNALPSNVINFSVLQIGDTVLTSQDRPLRDTDADFSHFELREGLTWSASTLVATFTQTKYPLTDYVAGTKNYMIKAVDTSGLMSAVEASFTITLVASSGQHIFYRQEEIQGISAASVSNVTRDYVFPYAGGFYISGTETMDDAPTETMDDAPTETMWTPAYSSGSLLTDVIDIGQIVTGKIYLTPTMLSDPGSAYTITYQSSQDNSTWTTEAPFVNGVIEVFRYLRFRVILTVDNTTYPQNNIEVTGLMLNIGMPTITNRGNNVVVAAGGTAVAFATPYTNANSIRIQATPGGSTALIVTCASKTANNFTAHVFNLSGTDVGGIIDWNSEGY